MSRITRIVFALGAFALVAAAPLAAMAAPKLYQICKPFKSDDGTVVGHLCKASDRATVWHAVRVVGTTESDGTTYYLAENLKE